MISFPVIEEMDKVIREKIKGILVSAKARDQRLAIILDFQSLLHPIDV